MLFIDAESLHLPLATRHSTLLLSCASCSAEMLIKVNNKGKRTEKERDRQRERKEEEDAKGATSSSAYGNCGVCD